MSLQALIILIIVGAIAGWLAGIIVKGGGFGLVGNIIVGILLAFIGSWLLGYLGVVIGGDLLGSILHPANGAWKPLFTIGPWTTACIPPAPPPPSPNRLPL